MSILLTLTLLILTILVPLTMTILTMEQAAANETIRLEAALEQVTRCISIRKRP